MRQEEASKFLKEGKKHKLIIGYMRLTLKISSIFSRYARNKSDEIKDVAIYELVRAVDKVPVDHPNIGAFIGSRVRNRLRNFLVSDSTIKFPHSMVGKATKLKQEKMVEPKYAEKDPGLVAFNDALEKSITTPMERRIIELRKEGHNDREVAEQTNVSPATVLRIREKVYQRYRRCA